MCTFGTNSEDDFGCLNIAKFVHFTAERSTKTEPPRGCGGGQKIETSHQLGS